MSSCLYCGSTERNFASKFCTDCGNNWPANQVVDQPADVHRYVEALYQSVQSSDFEDDTDLIKRMRTRFKISHGTHQNIISDLRERLQIVEGLHTFTVEFNQNDSDAYAEQDTLLQFRLINDAQGEQLKYAELSWDDPDSASGRGFKARTSLPVRPGASASLQGSHVFMRFGPKSIDRMQLRVENLLGDVGDFMVEPMVFNVRNPDQKISKSVTNIINQERGVVDNSSNLSDADGTPLTVGRQAIWKKLVLFPIVQRPDDATDLIAGPVAADPGPSAAPAQAPAPAPVPDAERAAPAPEPVAVVATAPGVSDASGSIPTKDDAKAAVTGEGSQTLAAVSKAADASAEDSERAIDSDDPHECASEVFKRLAWFAQASPVTKPHTAVRSDRFDLDFIEVIYQSVPDANEDDVLGMVFVDGESVVFDQHDCVINFDSLACVFSVAGVTQVSITDNTVNAESFHSWGDMSAMGWSFYRRRFGDDKFVVSFGDGSVSQNLPGCKFDLRQYKGDVPVSQVFDEANAWLDRLYELTPVSVTDDEPSEEEGASTPAASTEWPFDPSTAPAQESAQTSASEEDLAVEEDGYDDDADPDDEDEARQQTLDEIGGRMQRFFGKLDFALQRCEENQARCVYTRDRVDEALLQTLHDAVHNTGSGMRVVCVEPGCALLDPSGMLMGFKGSASVLCAEGIFHMVAQPAGGYMMDGSNAFLGWQRFFDELHGDLIVREEGPDLWLGNPMNYLIRGCYVDYSVQVIQWDYFENYVQKDLRSELSLFKESVDWL